MCLFICFALFERKRCDICLYLLWFMGMGLGLGIGVVGGGVRIQNALSQKIEQQPREHIRQVTNSNNITRHYHGK